MIHSSVNYIESHMNAERKTGKNRKKNKNNKKKHNTSRGYNTRGLLHKHSFNLDSKH